MIDGDKLAGELFADGSPVDLVERYGAEGQPPVLSENSIRPGFAS
jgi:hypothetical protein